MRMLLSAVSLATLFAAPAFAGPIQVEKAWARPAPAGLPTSAAYFVLRNTGRTADVLEGVSSPAARASVHESMAKGGMMTMHPMGPVVIPAGGLVVLKPGGMHVMLESLKRPLAQGDRLPLTLTFKKAGGVRVDAAVRATAP